MEFEMYDAAQARLRAGVLAEYERFLAARRVVQTMARSLRWDREGEAEVLIQEQAGGQLVLGRRSPATEQRFAQFLAELSLAQQALVGLQARLQAHQDMALMFGRVPDVVVDILQQLDAAHLDVRVTGANSLYAYEAAAGVRMARHWLASTHTRLQLAVPMPMEQAPWEKVLAPALPAGVMASLLDALRCSDASYAAAPARPNVLVNEAGFQVEIFCQVPSELGVTAFDQCVIGMSGQCVRMHVLHPMDFIHMKTMVAEHPDRDPADQAQDLLQVEIVQELLLRHRPDLLRQVQVDWSRWQGEPPYEADDDDVPARPRPGG